MYLNVVQRGVAEVAEDGTEIKAEVESSDEESNASDEEDGDMSLSEDELKKGENSLQCHVTFSYCVFNHPNVVHACCQTRCTHDMGSQYIYLFFPSYCRKLAN